MSVSMPLRQALVFRVEAVLQRRRHGPDEAAKRMGVCVETVQRLLAGKRCSLETLERFEEVYGVSLLDCDCRESTQNDASERKITLVQEQPTAAIVGWKTASYALGVSHDTLQRQRKAARVQRLPWWPSVAALREWYARLLERLEGQDGAA